MKRVTEAILVAAALVVVVLAGAGGAQTNFMVGVYFYDGVPTGEMSDQIDRNAYGLGGQIFYAPHTSPLAVGLDLGWMNYGRETRQEPFSITIPDVTVDVTTENNIVQAFLVLRGQMPTGPIQLYADGLVGLNYLYTETSISGTGGDDEEVVSHTNQDDAAFAYGFGGGFMVAVYTEKAKEGEGSSMQLLLDGGLRYVMGGEAEYLKKGSIGREDGVVTFDMIRSKTDMLRVHVGVTVRF